MRQTGKFIAALIVAAFALSPSGVKANAGACYTIDNADARNYCLAKARKEPSMCYTIQSSSIRSQCLAEVRKK